MTGPSTALPSHEAIAELVGHEAFARGLVLARSGHVSGVEFDEETQVISGRVKGTHRDAYAVAVRLTSSRSGAPSAYRAQCSCPVAMDCKHAAAVLVVARAQSQVVRRVERPEWEKALDKLLAAPGPEPSTDIAPLALEFGVETIPAFRGYVGRQDLRIRPARQGRSGAWVRSGISWDDLDFVARSYVPEHRELLLQFRAAAGASARFTLPRSAWLSLSTVTSAFWSLLEQAAGVGLTVLAERPLLGPLRSTEPAVVSLDVRRAGAAGLTVGPRVTVEGRVLPVTSVGVLGEPAHGIFHVDRSERGVDRLLVARLDTMLSRELRQLVVDARPLMVPADDEQRFLGDYAPSLRHRITLASSDGTVALPDQVTPTVALSVSFRDEHRVRLDWSLCYQVSGQTSSFEIDAPVEPRSVRDRAAELRLLDALPLPYGEIPQLAAGGLDAPRPAGHVLLEGRPAWHFVEHVLPSVEKEGVAVTLSGQVVEYRETTAAPQVAVSATARADSADWFDLHIQVKVEGEEVPFDQLFVALTQGEEYLILETGVYCALDRSEFVRLRDLIAESKALQDRDRPGLRISRFQASLWEELVDLGVVVAQTTAWSRTVAGLTDLRSVEAVDPPAGLAAELRPYQLEGYRWLNFLWSHQLGGILADDMGLGKTLQALALIGRARHEQPDAPPFLVVAPTSVVGNWAAEAARFTPGLRVVCLTETESRRRRPWAEVVDGADLVLTSYAVLRIDQERYADQDWSGVVLDEAQFVKNHRAKTYASARRLRSPFKLAITGTPLENSLMDLWALLSIVAPGLFPLPDRFSQFYRRPIERGDNPALLAQLRRRIRPLMLRRTKDLVAAELPPKQEQVLEVELAPRHQRIYQTHLQRERQKVLGLIDDLERNRFTVLRSLTLLRQLSLAAELVDPEHDQVPSAKIDLLVEQLAELTAEGHRALVFSQFTSFLGLVRRRLDEAGISHTYLDGRTRRRDRPIEAFRSGQASVFVISLKAGGFGLNLTEADYCFVLDPWWNPAVEAQAVDRTHRIGQTRPVMVYRLVARDTIEEKVMALKASKEQLFSAVLGEDALASADLTADEIRALLAG